MRQTVNSFNLINQNMSRSNSCSEIISNANDSLFADVRMNGNKRFRSMEDHEPDFITNKLTNIESQLQKLTLLDDILGKMSIYEEKLENINRNFLTYKSETDEKIEKMYSIMTQQQSFIEYLEGKERLKNMIITGVEETPNSLGENDNMKVMSIINATGYGNGDDKLEIPIKNDEIEIKRLGEQKVGKIRPIWIQVTNNKVRNKIIEKAKNLKSKGTIYQKIYIKKDTHPAVRKENGRLRQREKDERELPENQGVEILYDFKKRVLLRNGLVIDRYSPKYFL